MLYFCVVINTFPTCTHRPAPFTVLPKKSSYSALLGSPATESPDKEVRDEVDSGNGYRWKHLMSEGVQSSSADETSEKGHSRSTSLDLNKILLGQSVAGDGMCIQSLFCSIYNSHCI